MPVDQDGARLNSLQYVRAFAALAVVFYHIEAGVNEYSLNSAPWRLFAWGHYGVEVFFCLSGFVIAYSAFKKAYTPLGFLYGRVARLYPTYIYVALLFILALLIAPRGLVRSGEVFSWKVALDTLFFNYGISGGYVYVGWSLFYEMIFYCSFALIVYRFRDICKTGIFYLASPFAMLALQLMGQQRIALFFLGISIFLATSDPGSFGRKSPAMIAVVVGCIASLFFSLPTFICFAGLTLLLMLDRHRANWFQNRFILWLGDASYSIYLIQVLTLTVSLKTAGGIVAFFAHGITDGAAYVVFYATSAISGLFATIAAGLLIRKFVEKPSFHWMIGLRAGCKTA